MEFGLAVLLCYHTCGMFARSLLLLQDLQGQTDCVAAWCNPFLKSSSEFSDISFSYVNTPMHLSPYGKASFCRRKAGVKIINSLLPPTPPK